jgi:hypothetical protein
MASRFPLDELVHVELTSRMAMELGGGTEIQFEPEHMIIDAEPGLPPVLRAADMIARFFCVGEAVSIPLLRATWHAARHPLPRAVLGRIVKDEAAHGVFGFLFLDWALESMTEADRRHIAAAADRGILAVRALWRGIEQRRRAGVYDESLGDALGWLHSDAYLELAARSLETNVRKPLLERGIPISR